MTFAEFQASRAEVADLAAHTPYKSGPGFVYAGELAIEKDGSNYVLTIGNQITPSADLEQLERMLFDWAERHEIYG